MMDTAMQGDELKAVRSTLGLTQQALADAIGMSRKSVVAMETNKAPIERRTELAVRYLLLVEKEPDDGTH